MVECEIVNSHRNATPFWSAPLGVDRVKDMD
jgi:hypothetical protein